MSSESNSFNIPATRYIEALQRNGVDHFVTVPDWVQLALHLRVEAGIPGLRNVPCCNEEQAIAVAAGLWMGGRKPIVVVQNQGLHACINALRTIGNDVRAPIVFLVGQFGREFANFGKDPNESRRSTVRYLEPVLQAMEVVLGDWSASRTCPASMKHSATPGAKGALLLCWLARPPAGCKEIESMMTIRSACDVIQRGRKDALLVATMGAMGAMDALGVGQPRVSSVPLMGGAPGLGLGLALARPEHKVIVVDGDASLLMQLGNLVTVAANVPRNLYHFVICNGTQFSGMSNLPLPGRTHVDFCAMARTAG